MLHKKDYKAIAEILKAEKERYNDLAERLLIKSIASKLSNYFLQDNPKFKSDKFFEACGL